jgi:hypothetical protein
MGSVTKLSDRRPSTDPSLSIEFDAAGDFEALGMAQAYLAARDFSFGPQQVGAPIGVMHNADPIAKWRNLSAEEQNDLHGIITGDFRRGPVTISIRRDAPSAVIEAFRSTIPEGGTADPVGADLADAHPVIDGLEGEHGEDIRAQLHVEHRKVKHD